MCENEDVIECVVIRKQNLWSRTNHFAEKKVLLVKCEKTHICLSLHKRKGDFS